MAKKTTKTDVTPATEIPTSAELAAAPAANEATVEGVLAETAPDAAVPLDPEEAAVVKGRDVFSKVHLVDALLPRLQELLGVKHLAKAKAWDIYKTVLETSFELASQKPLSLSGIGTFDTISSGRSEKLGKPSLRAKFYASTRVNDILNDPTRKFFEPTPKTVAPAGDAAAVAPAGDAVAPAGDAAPAPTASQLAADVL